MMPDREKVLTKLAGIGIGLDMAGYHDDAQCVRDALALLAKQEYAKPKHTGIEPRYCGRCGLPTIFNGDRFCRWCGIDVQWNA